MTPVQLRKYKDMVSYFKELERQKTPQGKTIYRYETIYKMVADKFYLSVPQTEIIIKNNYD